MNTRRGPRYRQVPIWRDATRLLVEIEQAVRRFPLSATPADADPTIFDASAPGALP